MTVKLNDLRKNSIGSVSPPNSGCPKQSVEGSEVWWTIKIKNGDGRSWRKDVQNTTITDWGQVGGQGLQYHITVGFKESYTRLA